MNLGRNGIKIWDLQFDAADELYLMIDQHYKPMPKDANGKINPKSHAWSC